METTIKNEIVKINPADFGVEESKATQIAEQFKPMLDKMVELEAEYNSVVALDFADIKTSLKAKELRLKYVKVRTGTAAIHKQQKDFYLQAGRFIDGWKNAQIFASQGIEDKLESIEKHYENLEKERILKLKEERMLLLSPFDFDGSQMGLGTMDINVWENFLSGTKLQFEAKKAEEKRLELAKIETENEAIRERARIAAENLKLKADAEAKEKEIAKIEALRKLEQEKADKILEAQRKSSADKAAKEKVISDAKLKLEREAKEKLEAELKAKQVAEAKAEAEKQAEIKTKQLAEAKAAKAPDKDKLVAWLNSVDLAENKSLSSSEAIVIASDIRAKFLSFKKWANEQIKTL